MRHATLQCNAQHSLSRDLAATGTFKTDTDLGTGENDLDPLDMETQRLVLEAGPGGWVALRRKQYGARSQLWRMTGDGQLQHEGIVLFSNTVIRTQIITRRQN